jgi:GDPmannose 4,6-dehydratase
MLNSQESPDDYILATCESVSVKEFAERSFREAGYVEIEWQGSGSDEKLIDLKTSKTLLEIDPQFYRPGEVPFLRGDAEKIRTKLGW